MRHHHEEGRGPRGRHGDPSEHGDHGRRGGGRRQRFFGHGELRLIIPGYPQPQRQPWL